MGFFFGLVWFFGFFFWWVGFGVFLFACLFLILLLFVWVLVVFPPLTSLFIMAMHFPSISPYWLVSSPKDTCIQICLRSLLKLFIFQGDNFFLYCVLSILWSSCLSAVPVFVDFESSWIRTLSGVGLNDGCSKKPQQLSNLLTSPSVKVETVLRWPEAV